MISTRLTRRTFTSSLVYLSAGMSATAPVCAGPGSPDAGPAGAGLSHSSESIHQEIKFSASRARVYDALTNSEQFDAVTRLSDGLALVTAPGAKATSISPEVGGAFTLFGGYITGRNLELLPGERLVQAWRTAAWKPGEYSVARFALMEDGAGTLVNFDHRGFPDGNGTHLADGWHVHYWQPLAQYLRAHT